MYLVVMLTQLAAKVLRSPATVGRLLLDSLVAPQQLRWAGITHGRGLVLSGFPVVRCPEGGEIHLGDDVKLFSRPRSNPLQLTRPCTLWVTRPGGRIHIGSSTGLSGVVICAATSVQIGERVLLGANATIMDTDFHPASPDERQSRPQAGGASEPIVIGSDVFVGAFAIILKGTTLGDGCTVAQGAVVSGAYPPHCIIAGNPARAMRR